MKTKINYIILFLLLVTKQHALEVRVGQGDFKWNFGINNFMHADFTLDITTLSLIEQHQNIQNTPYYYFFSADIYRSSAADKITTLMAYPITYDFPIVGSFDDNIEQYTPIPTPSDYKIRGFDLLLGVGYDLYQNNRDYLGLGVVTGLSLPVMKMSNLQKSAEFLYDLLETTQTDIKTYKFGPTIQGAYKLTPKLSSYATFGFGYQTGEMKNEWFRSSIDIDGSFQALDLGVSYIPFTKHDRLKITLGYNYKSWEMDDIEVDMFNIFKVSTFGTLKNDFSTNYFYLGAAYRF